MNIIKDMAYTEVVWDKYGSGGQVSSIIIDGLDFQQIKMTLTFYDRMVNCVFTINTGNVGVPSLYKSYNKISVDFIKDMFDIDLYTVDIDENIMKKIAKFMVASKMCNPPAFTTPQPQNKQSNMYKSYPKKKLNMDDFELHDDPYQVNQNMLRHQNSVMEKKIEAQDARIKELEQELLDLKEEIEMLQAVNEEC